MLALPYKDVFNSVTQMYQLSNFHSFSFERDAIGSGGGRFFGEGRGFRGRGLVLNVKCGMKNE